MRGVRGRVAGRKTVGSRQRPHTERSRQAAEALNAGIERLMRERFPHLYTNQDAK